ncbi:MAG: hypothetical protein CSB13_06210 [Chloroflexi bacterium]|nr:MAG: hypothetical protein CSB13_06210 [Chloroflexota bacterium]
MISTNLLVILPILLPLVGAVGALLLQHKRPLRDGWTLLVMLVSMSFSFWLLVTVWQHGEPLVYQSGGWPAPFGISLVADMLSALFVVMVQVVMATGVIYALGSKDVVISYPAFFTFFLMLCTGLTGAIMTGDLFNMYVFAELLVISGTVLTAVSDDKFGTEAAYKYFYISLLASFFMLLAIGCLYVSYGTLNMAHLAEAVRANPERPFLRPAIAFLLATFMVKSATFPFHFWQPDFHTAAPTPVSAMLSSVVVKFGVYGFLRMTLLLFVAQAVPIRLVLLVAGVIGVIFGGLSALGTHNVKRMLAYSTLAQVGFILVAISWGTELAITTAIVFAFNHSLIKAAMLMLAGYVASRASVKSAAFDVVTGVGKPLPVAGVLFFVGSLALAGIPPTNGFVSKSLLFTSGFDSAHYWSLLLIGVTSIFTLMYTIRAFQRIWWLTPSAGIYTKPTGDQLVAPVILLILIVGLGIWASPLVTWAQAAAAWLGDPLLYIQAVLGG